MNINKIEDIVELGFEFEELSENQYKVWCPALPGSVAVVSNTEELTEYLSNF